MSTKRSADGRGAAPRRPGERGMAMIALLATLIIVTTISLSLIGIMNTDITHASIQYAVARSFYIAQAGLEEAKLKIRDAADPSTYATQAEGVRESYGGGEFTYWVDNGQAAACGAGLTVLEAVGRVAFLNRTLSTRVRACAVAGAPFLTALFGVSRIQLQGAASRVYLAPALTGTPGRGGSLGSFTEINFAENDVQLNAVNDAISGTVTLRDGRFRDYELFGFSAPPRYDPSPMTNPAPWILAAFGDIIKAQPATGAVPNACGTLHACVTAGNGISDIKQIAELRDANYRPHVYMNNIREETLPVLALSPEAFRAQAAQNTANAELNKKLGIPHPDSVYALQQFYQIVAHLTAYPSTYLRGMVFINGAFRFTQKVSLGDITLAVAGDLTVDHNAAVTIRHDLSTASGRRIPGVVVFGTGAPSTYSAIACDGERVNGSGRFVLCEGSALTVDGLIYTRDGMALHSGAFVDQVGAMYHGSGGTATPSFSARDATVVLRFDPLALAAFGSGAAILSWQQVR